MSTLVPQEVLDNLSGQAHQPYVPLTGTPLFHHAGACGQYGTTQRTNPGTFAVRNAAPAYQGDNLRDKANSGRITGADTHRAIS